MARVKTKINMKLGDMVLCVGGTGSGKTTLGKQLLLQFATATQAKLPIYVIDSKMQGDFDQFYQPGWGKNYFGNELPPLENEDGSPFIIWQPEYDDKDTYNSFFMQIYSRRKPAVVFIDELASVSNNQYAPRYLDIILKMGRGLGITCISNTQVARLLPLSVSSQVMHTIKFNVNSEKDNKKMEDLLGKAAFYDIPDRHGFFYRDITKPIKTNPAIYYKDLTEFFGI